MPLYYVRVAKAPDLWIGIITTAQTAVTLFGYFFWVRQSRRRGSRFVLLWAALATALYPALLAATVRLGPIALLAGLAGIFQAGIDLVFFDEMMKTVPPAHAATFVSIAQSTVYLSAVAAPVLGTVLADFIGIGGGLLVSAGLCFVGFVMFLLGGVRRSQELRELDAVA